MITTIGKSGLDPGSGFRFAVGSARGLKSTVYRIWTAKNASDVYITALPTSGTLKVSLHESGEWQHSFLSQVAMNYVSTNAERHIEKWPPPKPLGGGWIRGYYITIPRTELRYGNEDVTGVRWAEDPGYGYWVNIEVVLADAGVDTVLTWESGILLGSLRLRNGGGATVFARRYKPDAEAARRLGAYRDLVYRQGTVADLAMMNTPVLSLFGYEPDGTRGVTEVSLGLPPAAVRIICTGEPLTLPGAPMIRWRNRDVTSLLSTLGARGSGGSDETETQTPPLVDTQPC